MEASVAVAGYIILGVVALVALVIGTKKFLKSEAEASRKRALEDAQHRAEWNAVRHPAPRSSGNHVMMPVVAEAAVSTDCAPADGGGACGGGD